MMETREMGRLYMKAAGNAVATIADHNRKSMKLSGASAMRSFEYLAQLASAKTGIEAIEVSGAHYRNQLNALGEYTDNFVDLARKMRRMCLDPSEREGS
jgi:Phasin protein